MRKSNASRRWDFEDVGAIRRFLDDMFPEVGTDNAYFAAMVVMFSSAVLETSDVEELCRFSGYNRHFVEGIVWNLRLNGLLKNGYYDVSTWLSQHDIDDDRFSEETQAALGCLWFDEGTLDWTIEADLIPYLQQI
jgi:hypothetical protein